MLCCPISETDKLCGAVVEAHMTRNPLNRDSSLYNVNLLSLFLKRLSIFIID